MSKIITISDETWEKIKNQVNEESKKETSKITIYKLQKSVLPKLRKDQKCFGCKKIIKKDFAWNGYYWHEKCIEKEAIRRYKKHLN